jgi:hypothetical protein
MHWPIAYTWSSLPFYSPNCYNNCSANSKDNSSPNHLFPFIHHFAHLQSIYFIIYYTNQVEHVAQIILHIFYNQIGHIYQHIIAKIRPNARLHGACDETGESPGYIPPGSSSAWTPLPAGSPTVAAPALTASTRNNRRRSRRHRE